MRRKDVLRETKVVAPILKGVSFILVLLPAVFAFIYVRLFGVDIPFGDAWTMVPRFDKLYLGTLSFSDLWVQHWEHRVFFPRIALLLLGVFTNYDNVAVMYLIQACFLITTITFFVAFRASISSRLLFFVPVPFLVFNLAQYFNMFHAMQLALVFAQMFAVIALCLLYASERASVRKFAFPTALASGIVASFSLGSGLLVWPAGFLQLLIAPFGKRMKMLLLGIWSFAGLAAWVIYFIGLRIPERQESSFIFNDPGLGVKFFLTAIGSSLAWQPSFPITSAFIVGVVLACVIALSLFLIYRASKLGGYSFWIGVLTFSLLCALSITAARTGAGIEQALQSRYVTFTGLAIVSAYAMLVKLTLERGSHIVVSSLGLLLVLIAVGLTFSYTYGINSAEVLNVRKEDEAAVLSTYRSQPDKALSIANRNPERIKENAFVLCKLGYSVFSEPGVQRQNCLPPSFSDLSPASSSISSKIQTVSGQRVANREGPITISGDQSSLRVTGWAAERDKQRPAGGVYIKVDDKSFPAFYGRSRKIASTPAYEFSGFERAIPVSAIGPGKHKISIIALTNDQRRYYQSNEEITIRVN